MAPKYHAPRRDEFPDALSGGEGRESPGTRVGERERQSPSVENVDPALTQPDAASVSADVTREDRPQALAQPDEVEKEMTVEEKLGTHPLGASAGAVGGTVAGAAIGAAAGPVGSLVGAVAGALLGSGLGASASDAQSPVIDTAPHDDYWRDNYAARPYMPPWCELRRLRARVPVWHAGLSAHGPSALVGRRRGRAQDRLGAGPGTLALALGRGTCRGARRVDEAVRRRVMPGGEVDELSGERTGGWLARRRHSVRAELVEAPTTTRPARFGSRTP